MAGDVGGMMVILERVSGTKFYLGGVFKQVGIISLSSTFTGVFLIVNWGGIIYFICYV